MIATSYSKFFSKAQTLASTNPEVFEGIDNDLLQDILLSEAINHSVANADAEIKTTSDSGTTLTSLFLTNRSNNGVSYTRAVVGNLGDARCVLVTSRSPKDSLSSHKHNSSAKANDHKPPSLSLDTSSKDALDASYHSETLSPTRQQQKSKDLLSSTIHSFEPSTFSGKFSDNNQNKIHPKVPLQNNLCVEIVHYDLSFDHKLSNLRERYRIDQKLVLKEQLLPFDLSIQTQLLRHWAFLFSPSLLSPHNEDNSQFFREIVANVPSHYRVSEDVEGSKKADDLDIVNHQTRSEKLSSRRESAAIEPKNRLILDPKQRLISCIEETIDEYLLLKYGLDSKKADRLLRALNLQEKFPRLPLPVLDEFIVRQDSFIGHRYSPDGKIKGPLAYFGRHEKSILMTRSLGDRLGPRGCIAQTELTSVSIPSSTHVRFVIASDGVWDVIDSETIRRMALCHKYHRNDVLATTIAYKALRRRNKLHMRQDDITVQVIDVNPEKARFIKSKTSQLNELHPVISLLDQQELLSEKQLSNEGNTPIASINELINDCEEESTNKDNLDLTVHSKKHLLTSQPSRLISQIDLLSLPPEIIHANILRQPLPKEKKFDNCIIS